MWKSAVAMLAGVLAVLALPELPAWPVVAAAGLTLLFAAVYWRRLRWLAFFAVGICWCALSAEQHLAARLDPAFEGRSVPLVGWISSLPERRGDLTEFNITVESLGGRAPQSGIPGLLRLSVAAGAALPHAGEHWRFDVRLRRPRGFMDPGAFDYEAWLFFHDIGGTGYVLDGESLQGSRYPLLRVRDALRRRLDTALAASPFGGMLTALVTGDQGGISETQWKVLQATGTVHLMAIAGLHIGVVAGLLFLLVRALWRRSIWLSLRCPAAVAAAVASFAGALFYAALAGFTLPTQRALIMLAAFTLGVVLRRRLRALDTLSLALLGVLLWDPLAAGESSFWLSFAAVAAILFVFSARVRQPRGRLRELLQTQWAVTVGLLPLLAFFFQQAGFGAPLANFVAVPVYAFSVIPLTLLGAALLPAWPWAGAGLLKLAALGAALIWPILQWLASQPALMLPAPEVAWPLVAVALSGAFWLLLPRAVPGRLPAASLMLPLFIAPASGIAAGNFNFTLLDVGQGLAGVVRTANHVLIYDTGPRFLSGSDTGQEVLIPYLRSQGIQAPDLVVVSHGDNDHSGGLASLRATFPRLPVYTGAMDRVPDAAPCLRGQHWDWDGVHFVMLYPDENDPLKGNDASCVLRVSSAAGSVLLVGDLMKKGEARLLTAQPDLRSDLLIAPHHGSNSSSTPPFVAAVQPREVLFPVGYRNRWNFPKEEVVARYLPLAGVADTANDGALCVYFRDGTRPVLVTRWRRDAAQFWTEK